MQIASQPINVRVSVSTVDVIYVITVEWNRPLQVNGNIDEYFIQMYQLNDTTNGRTEELSLPLAFRQIKVTVITLYVCLCVVVARIVVCFVVSLCILRHIRCVTYTS